MRTAVRARGGAPSWPHPDAAHGGHHLDAKACRATFACWGMTMFPSIFNCWCSRGGSSPTGSNQLARGGCGLELVSYPVFLCFRFNQPHVVSCFLSIWGTLGIPGRRLKVTSEKSKTVASFPGDRRRNLGDIAERKKISC